MKKIPLSLRAGVFLCGSAGIGLLIAGLFVMSSFVDDPVFTCDFVFVVATVFSVGYCVVVHGLEDFVNAIAYRRICEHHFLVIGSEFCDTMGSETVAADE